MSFTLVLQNFVFFCFYSGCSGWIKTPFTEISLVKCLTNICSDKGDVILIFTPMFCNSFKNPLPFISKCTHGVSYFVKDNQKKPWYVIQITLCVQEDNDGMTDDGSAVGI